MHTTEAKIQTVSFLLFFFTGYVSKTLIYEKVYNKSFKCDKLEFYVRPRGVGIESSSKTPERNQKDTSKTQRSQTS
jgi:hypothetical protein